jgi:hypothetical protein
MDGALGQDIRTCQAQAIGLSGITFSSNQFPSSLRLNDNAERNGTKET